MGGLSLKNPMKLNPVYQTCRTKTRFLGIATVMTLITLSITQANKKALYLSLNVMVFLSCLWLQSRLSPNDDKEFCLSLFVVLQTFGKS